MKKTEYGDGNLPNITNSIDMICINTDAITNSILNGVNTNDVSRHSNHRRSQYEANRGTRLGKILPNTVDFYFFYQTDNIRRFHTADFVQRTVCSPRL